MFTLEQLEKELLKDADYKKVTEDTKKDVAYRVARMMEEARAIKNMTQAELAEAVGTKQSAIARLESGNSLPSLRMLIKIAKAFGTYLIPPRFAFMKKIEEQYDDSYLKVDDIQEGSGEVFGQFENINNIVFMTNYSVSDKFTNSNQTVWMT